MRTVFILCAAVLLSGCYTHIDWSGDAKPAQSADASHNAYKDCVRERESWDEWRSRADHYGGTRRNPFPSYRLSKQRDSGWETAETCVKGDFKGFQSVPRTMHGWFDHPEPPRY